MLKPAITVDSFNSYVATMLCAVVAIVVLLVEVVVQGKSKRGKKKKKKRPRDCPIRTRTKAPGRRGPLSSLQSSRHCLFVSRPDGFTELFRYGGMECRSTEGAEASETPPGERSTGDCNSPLTVTVGQD
ncbi:hypothetical protein ASPZODRAFT_133170 [Penicilliopsis zonata CBS 506.65]|uniref:Uncharacterized protein n=1 Tax=Penicilliopsis zonata CBS 506.65 TaxID=1073090 RepID=A0A1L9SFW2_9EURO|nr:hypothetical protein ASPZODRAFT_133170 [Penicilliopsis zonata CBS 506.65]OJJ46165.1 hypothetical protein ASPZODRAFT_133170 [Penicilliopsis zonata CBS 506.65]